MTDEQKVKAVYSDTFAAKIINANLWMIQRYSLKPLGPGLSGWEGSELLAWKVAASGLPASRDSRKEIR